MRITPVLKEEANKKIYQILVDGVYSFSITEEDYLKYNLYEKDELSEDEINNIRRSVDFRSAKEAALNYISYKFRTEKEVKTKLQNENFSDDVVSDVLADLKADGYINDKLYVSKYLNEKRKLNPKSKRILILELKKKGIPPELILNGLDELEFDNVLVAEELVRKKFPDIQYSGKSNEKKIYKYLQYKGFSNEEIKTVLKKLFLS